MTKAVFKAEGTTPIEGMAEIGGDYVRLSIDARTNVADLSPPVRGEIEIDGKSSEVALENVTPAADGNGGAVLTLRLFKPIG